MNQHVKIETRIPGRDQQSQPPVVAIDAPSSGRMTLRQLIEAKVRAQVASHNAALAAANPGDAQDLSDGLGAEYLAPGDIARRLDKKGELVRGGRRTFPRAPERVDPDKAVARAIDACNKGVFRVFADGCEVQSLDEEIPLTTETKVTFLRLVPLVGG